MIRRDGLKLIAASVLGSGMILRSAPSLSATATTHVVFDGRFASARAFAAGCSAVHDCQADAASTWFDDLWPDYRQGMTIVGVTTAADALIIADCARREGLACDIDRTAQRPDGLVSWIIA